MEHELENSWTLYVTKQRTVQGFEKNKKEWEDRLTKIHTFGTVESFWSVHNNLRSPSEMTNDRGDYYLFKDMILPEWEDSLNVGGGSLILNFDPFKADDVWSRVQLSLIGNFYHEFSRYICGVELAIRKNRFKIAIWISDVDVEIARKLANEVKAAIEVLSIEFRRHTTGDKIEFSIK
ncbi:hypothetical protein SteCoe_14004 [Stentor coeruleus]|uniref:Uncharacterized protein n=1 Tax=Stentor coeruleus TaxID=5963 RepID=A0A1R2C730_9CILI|nr:hypothetical protein SteCoe_14004 [Stentor coeruleus]